jgi:hypothetical protein
VTGMLVAGGLNGLCFERELIFFKENGEKSWLPSFSTKSNVT